MPVARPRVLPSSITSYCWNTGEAYAKHDKHLSAQRQKAYYRLAKKATFAGGLETNTTEEDIPGILDDLRSRNLTGIWSDHPNRRYGTMVTFDR